MKKLISIAVLALTLAVSALFTACGSSSKSSTPGATTTSAKQLDPQGNWLFTVTDNNGTTLTWGEELFELTPPAVTSNTGIGYFVNGDWFTMGVSGTVSGTATITYTATGTNGIPGSMGATPLGTLSLTGTIAESQTSTSGTWTTTGLAGTYTAGFQAGDSGTWTAQLLAPVTGSYSGTLTGNGNTISVAASFTENTSQTSGNMGDVTGTITISGSPCFNSGTPLDLYAAGNNLATIHIGEYFRGQTVPDANGQTVFFQTSPTGVDPATAALNNIGFNISGGPCNGQQFTGTLNQ